MDKRGDDTRDIEEELRTYPLVTANDLRNRRERPKELKMLTREFIDGKQWPSSSELTLLQSAVLLNLSIPRQPI